MRNALERHGVKFIEQYRFLDCVDKSPLPFDFYIPEWGVCIEFQGLQHFVQVRNLEKNTDKLLYRKKHDRIKREYCENHGILLLAIRYNDDVGFIINTLCQIIKNYYSLDEVKPYIKEFEEQFNVTITPTWNKKTYMWDFEVTKNK